ncbi:MAG: deferrochelatase/peroxidase EfeB [Actinobacteria bacterium]|nr:deferrochelatase/peroxidase EfeB [Actinomycetota bacterium]
MRRRELLVGGAALGAGALAARIPGVATAGAAEATDAPADASLTAAIPFEGAHQAGILDARPNRAIVVSFDAISASRGELAAGLRTVSDRARALTAGYDALFGPTGEGPTPDSGIVGPRVDPDALTITIGFGASLFDRRFGLAARRPIGLKPMPTFPDDALVDAECHGDVLVQLCANTEETLLHALRDISRETRGVLGPRWKVEGFLPSPRRESGAGRNLLGFKDGTANPDVADEGTMAELVWTGSEEPAWARGGTYAAVRIIRNRVEFWDRVSLAEQELMIGRDKAKGAPLGKDAEMDDPDYASDPDGKRIPLDAHIRLARPRTPADEGSRILRRPYNYSRAYDEADQLDMGLLFISFQRDLEAQFEAVQNRLAGEPLVDYIVPTGGGYFFLPPGARGSQDWVGSALFV